jgi:hypothetical protein
MNWKRVLIFVAVAMLLATIFTPRFSRHDRYYQFAPLVEDNARLDYNQWIVNLCIALSCGFLLSQLPQRALKWLSVLTIFALMMGCIIYISSAYQEQQKLRHQKDVFDRVAPSKP